MTSREKAKRDRIDRAKIHRLARDIRDQSNLEDVLLKMRVPRHRRIFYEMIKPALKFESTYPEWLARFDPDFVPVEPSLEVRP